MYVTHRPKILNRPLKTPTQGNKESSEAQFEREQEYWKTRSNKFQETQDRLNGSLYPTIEHKLKAQKELQVVMQQQMQTKMSNGPSSTHVETQPAGHLPCPAQSPEHLARPWTATTLSYSKADEDAARRRHAQTVSQENRALIEQREHQRQQQLHNERMQDRQQVHTEDNWWNLGAATDRWIPPEYRMRPKTADYRPPPSTRPPWACELDAKPHNLPGPRQPQQAASPLPAKTFPWTWQT